MPVYKEKGKLYIENSSIRHDDILARIKEYGQKELLKRHKLPKLLFHQLKEKLAIEYDQFIKLSTTLNLPLDEMLFDYCEETYDDLDLDLNKIKPAQAEISDTIKQCKLRMATIKHYVEQSQLSVEKKNKVYQNIERLMLECQYLGVQKKWIKQENEIIAKIEKERNNRND